jgi:hypothetical protein
MLRKVGALCLILMLTALAHGRQTTMEWMTFRPEGGRFSILMPGTPEVNAETAQSKYGPYTTHIFIARGNGELFIAGWVDYAPDFNFDVEGEIKANRDNFLKDTGKLLSEKKITLDGNPGLEFTAETTDGQRFITSRVYVVGKRPYQLIAITTNRAELVNTNRFLNSFKLLPK